MATGAFNANARNFRPLTLLQHPARTRLHYTDIDEWLDSITGCSAPLTKHNWVDGPCEKRDDPTSWITDKPDTDIDTFYNVAVGLLLQNDRLRYRPELLKFLTEAAPHALWAVFCSPWAWSWEAYDWGMEWELVLRKCAWIFNGYPVDQYAVCIPTTPDTTGEFAIHWDIPYRCYFKPGNGRVEGFNVTFAKLRIWTLKTDKSLISNSTWNGVTITNCIFMRCSFRNTTFTNVHFLDCTFTDVDFCDVTITNSLIANTNIDGTSIRNSRFDSASWCYNKFVRCVIDDVRSIKSNWTQIWYTGMNIFDYTESERSENWVGNMANESTC